jgi:hypothetical protein
VIEAKGEDAGGYATSQMNFQMALGQIASRMVDPGSTYAIAFPDTPNYRRVLRTFRGSLAFAMLRLRFYLVTDDQARAIEADDVEGWVTTL